MSKQPAPDAGSKRAAEVSEAMMGVPGYADDSMMAMMRYGAQCKQLLRQADFEELTRSITHELGKLEMQDATPIAEGDEAAAAAAAAARAERKAELKARVMEIIGGFPELVRGFDQFLVSTMAVTAAMRK